MTNDPGRTEKGTLKRDPDAPKMAPPASDEERRARIEAAKAKALAAKQGGGAAPAAAPAAVAAPVEAEVTAAPEVVLDDRPRTASGTLKRDPNEPKKQAPATPEERAARIAAAKAAAAAAKAGGGSTTIVARAGGGGGAAAAPVEGEVVEATPPSDGLARTAKGTLKRDPNEPKKQAPATPEERAARIAAAKAAAAAAKEQAKSAPPAAATAAPAARTRPGATPARGAGVTAEDQAAFVKAFEAVTKPIPGAAEPIARPVSGRGERAPAPAEFELTEAARATVEAFRAALPRVEFQVVASPIDAVLVIDRADVLSVMRAAKSHPLLDMKFLRCISGVDLMDEGIEVVYHLKSLTTKHAVEIKTVLPPGDPVVDSVTPVWQGANWHERELMEMFGVRCVGHPDPRHLLLDEDLNIHPLLKAHPLQDLELKQGVNVF